MQAQEHGLESGELVPFSPSKPSFLRKVGEGRTPTPPNLSARE